MCTPGMNFQFAEILHLFGRNSWEKCQGETNDGATVAVASCAKLYKSQRMFGKQASLSPDTGTLSNLPCWLITFSWDPFFAS